MKVAKAPGRPPTPAMHHDVMCAGGVAVSLFSWACEVREEQKRRGLVRLCRGGLWMVREDMMMIEDD